MSKFSTAVVALLCLLVSLLAPLVAPVALLFTSRHAKALPRAFAWFDTPDEPELIGLYEPSVLKVYNTLGWFAAAWVWFGLRNRAHGFASLWAESALQHWPDDLGTYRRGEVWIIRRRLGPLLFVFGWPVWASRKFSTGLEHRPMLSVKYRPRGK